MSNTEFTIRRKVFTLFGAKFHVFDQSGGLIGFSRQKAFRLKEDIRFYTDESMSCELLAILARQVIDFGASYDVIDSSDGQKVGALRRKGFRSLVRDEWHVLDPADRPLGVIREDSVLAALLRRSILRILPQNFHLADVSGNRLAELRTHFNPFVHRLTVSVNDQDAIDPLLVLAAGILLLAIEGRQ